MYPTNYLIYIIRQSFSFSLPSGSGMKKVGINDKDLFFFKATEKPDVGSIVVAEIDGEFKCCEYISRQNLRQFGRVIIVLSSSERKSLCKVLISFGKKKMAKKS